MVALWHEPYQWRILGRECAPHRGRMENREDVLGILSCHPGTARIVCKKDRTGVPAGRSRSDHGGPDGPTLQRRLRNCRSRTSRSDLRPSGASFTSNENGFHVEIDSIDRQQNICGPPTRDTDPTPAWTGANTLKSYIDIALSGLEEWFARAKTDPALLAICEVPVADLAAQHADALAPRQGAAIAASLAGAFSFENGSLSRDLLRRDLQGLATSTVAFAAHTPEFLLRSVRPCPESRSRQCSSGAATSRRPARPATCGMSLARSPKAAHRGALARPCQRGAGRRRQPRLRDGRPRCPVQAFFRPPAPCVGISLHLDKSACGRTTSG